MVQLLIVRHAIAEDRAQAARQGLEDAERPLTKKGIRRMQSIAVAIARQLPGPLTLLSSPLLRARQTAELLAAHSPGSAITLEAALSPGTPMAQLIERLQQYDEKGTVVVVGHEPMLSDLTALLLFGREDASFQLKKGGAALLAFPRRIEAAGATLMWLLTPKQLRTIGEAD
jgi:phosphohistidine phosphatase